MAKREPSTVAGSTFDLPATGTPTMAATQRRRLDALTSVEPILGQAIAIGERRMDLDRKLKTALDESRLLILGAQVLFGFLFQAVFQDLFRDVPPASQSFISSAANTLGGDIGRL
jgi:Family of unknown function (DUF6328)